MSEEEDHREQNVATTVVEMSEEEDHLEQNVTTTVVEMSEEEDHLEQNVTTTVVEMSEEEDHLEQNVTTTKASSADEHGLSVTQIALNILGFLGTVATAIVIAKYAKRQLETMKKEDETLLQ